MAKPKTCCEVWEAKRTAVRVLHALGALDTPRRIVMAHRIDPGLALGALPHCPCNDTPDPVATRAFMARAIREQA